jgi:ABC-2 type transport system ATP-binding protein
MDEAEHCDAVGFMFDGRLIASGTPRKLKSLLPGSSWEIPSDEPLDLADRLEGTAGLLEAAVFGRSVRLLVESGQERLAESLGARRIVPSLEDVFVHLVKRERGSEAA